MFPGSQIWRTGSPCDQTLQGNGSHLANPILRVGVGNIGRWSSPRHSFVHKARGWDMAVRAPQTQAEWACLSHDRMAPLRWEFRSGSCPLSPSKYRTSLNPVSLRPRKQVGTGPLMGLRVRRGSCKGQGLALECGQRGARWTYLEDTAPNTLHHGLWVFLCFLTRAGVQVLSCLSAYSL